MNKYLISTMFHAVRKHDIKAFQSAIDAGFDVTMRVPVKKGFGTMPFVEKVVRSRFSGALRVLLVETCPSPISVNDAFQAFQTSVRCYAPKNIMNVFLEASITNNLPFLNLTDSYRYTMECDFPVMTRRVIDTTGFDANGSINLYPGLWESPLAMAIKKNHTQIAARLLELGAEVDAPNSSGFTPLKLACGKVSFSSCHLLIRHGADPNSANGLSTNAWPFGSNDILKTAYMKNEFHSALCSWGQSNEAERILLLLLKAGLRREEVSWLQHKVMANSLSTAAGTRLKEILNELPSLQEISIISGREFVRKMKKGPGCPQFDKLVDSLNIPKQLKQMLKMEIMQ